MKHRKVSAGDSNSMTWYSVSSDTNFVTGALLPPKPPDGKVNPSKHDFEFGNCAHVAICSAFDISLFALNAVCKALGIEGHEEGLTYHNCRKVINLLCNTRKWGAEYKSNRGKITYAQMLDILDRGKYLVLFEEHLSYTENGKIYDSFICRYEDYKKLVPIGWWRVN